MKRIKVNLIITSLSLTPQEINSINARTKELVLNKVQSNKELRDKAIHNTKQNINDILNTEIIYTTSDFDVVEHKNNITILK